MVFYTEEQLALKLKQYTDKLVIQDALINQLRAEKQSLIDTLAIYQSTKELSDLRAALKSAQDALEIEITKVKDGPAS